MKNRPKLVTLGVTRDIGDGDGDLCFNPICGSLRSNSGNIRVAICLTVRLERNKLTRRRVGNPSPSSSSLHFHVTS